MGQLQRITIQPSQKSGDRLQLTQEQQHYLRRVLRLRSCDRFIAIAPESWWLAELTEQSEDATVLEQITVQTELPAAVILLVAMPKGSGMDDIVRQVTELGVSEIVPVSSQRTLMQPGPQKRDRWQKIAQEAVEQSERQLVPIVHEPLSFSQAIARWNGNTTTPFLCEGRRNPPHLLALLSDKPPDKPPNRPIVIATGPEGGWTETEQQQAIAQGYRLVSLGQRILRAVTAPLVAMTIVSSVLESMAEQSQSD